jgi:dipeptidase E
MRGGERQIVAFGGGGFSMERGNALLDDYVLSLSERQRPRICFLPTASGDADHYVVRFYRAFDPSRCEPSHVSLFRRDHRIEDVHRRILSSDIVYVGGGSVISLLGAWRAHGLDVTLRRAWERGVIMCGLSAGSLCWFAEAVSAFHGPPQWIQGLGLLPHSNCVHLDAEPERQSAYSEMLAAGMVDGFAAEDGAALHFVGDRLARVISSRPEARAYRMRRAGDAVVSEALAVDYLGAAPAVRAA